MSPLGRHRGCVTVGPHQASKGGVVSVSSSLAGEMARGMPLVTGLAERMSELELYVHHDSFVRGLSNPFGVIEIKPPYAKSAIEQLKRQLDMSGEPVQLGSRVQVHSIEHSPMEGASDRGFSQYIALVGVIEQDGKEGTQDHGALVPLTEIHEASLGDPSDVSNGTHPAFVAHLRWLVQERQGIDQIERHPTFIVPQQTSKVQMRDLATYAAFLDAAFAQSRLAMLMALNNDRSEHRTIRSSFDEDNVSSRVTSRPRGGSWAGKGSAFLVDSSGPSSFDRVVHHGGDVSDLCLPRKGGSFLSKVAAAFKVTGPSSPSGVARGRSLGVSESAFRTVVELPNQATLRGRRPEHGDVSREWAFIDKQQTPNLCGVAAINGFFQTSVLAGKHAVKEIVNSYLGVLDGKERAKLLGNLPGLFHPKVVRAMRRGESVTISREEFFQVPDTALNDVMYPPLNEEAQADGFGAASEEIKNQTRVAEQWRAYFNFKYPGQANREALIHDSQVITISPDEWISTFAGLGFEHLIKLTNDLLKTKGRDMVWRDYPDRVSGVVLAVDGSEKLRQLESLSLAIERLGVKHLICMGGGGMTGHYFAVVRNAMGHWFKVDGAHPSFGAGFQPVKSHNVANPSNLSSKLQEWGVTHVIADQRLIHDFQYSTGE